MASTNVIGDVVTELEQLSIIRTTCCDAPCLYVWYVKDSVVRTELPSGWGLRRGVISRQYVSKRLPQNKFRFRVDCCRGAFELTVPGHVTR